MSDKITLEVLEGPGWATDEDNWEHYSYQVRLTSGEQTMEVPWRQGLGITDDPTAGRVLEALLSDAATIENAESFEDWAAELGYDTDSRKAEKIYNLVQEQTNKLRDLLGNDFDSAVFPADYADSEEVAKRLVQDASTA